MGRLGAFFRQFSNPGGPGGERPSAVLNLVLYKIGWVACVVGAATGRPGWVLTALLISVHVALAVDRARELKLITAALLLGLGAEAALLASGVLRYTGDPGAALLPPVWIAVLWLQFGSVQHFGMKWLSGRYALAGFLGATGAPPTYLAGERMGAATLGDAWLGLPAIVVIAAVWGLAMPALVWLADRWQPARAAYAFARAL